MMKNAIGLALLAVLTSAPALHARLPKFVPDNPPDGVSLGDWAQIRAEYERHRHSAVPDGPVHKARNPRQQWRIRFDGRGFDVEPEAGGWRWGLELVGFADTATEVVVEGNRVSYRWSDGPCGWRRLFAALCGPKLTMTASERISSMHPAQRSFATRD